MEAVAALAIASIALLSLLHLQLLAMRTADTAQALTQAVLLAQEKMAETLSAGYPSVGVKSGLVEAHGGPFTWRLEVTDARWPLPQRSPAGRDRLRKLSVEVSGPKGPGDKPIHLTTYVAENATRGV
jgi:type II secretory pathway pseudopilin PulG